MRRINLDVLTGAFVTLLCVATGVPVLLLQLAGNDPTTGPAWLWWLAFGGHLAALLVVTWGLETLRSTVLRRVFAAQLLFGAVTVLLAPRVGWVPILLVFTAALGAYVVGPRTVAAIVVGNTVVIATAAAIGHGGALEILMSGLLYLLIQGVSVMAVVGQQRQELAQRELAEAHADLRATSALLADSSRAAERLRIARDLHDVVGHQLTALALELEVASHHSTPPASEHVARARMIAKELLADVRATVGQLRGPVPELRTTLEAVATGLPRPRVHLDVADGLALDEPGTTAVVRCVQEIVTNTIRHAGASTLWIEVDADGDGAIVLTGRDDGRGATDVTLGNGLRGLRERVEQLGGTVAFDGARGFAVVARIPAAVPAT